MIQSLHALRKIIGRPVPFSAICLFLMVMSSSIIACTEDPPPIKMKVIVDADTANEVDDLFALVRAIAAPSIDLLAITSAQFHTSPLASDSTVLESQLINEEIRKLMGADDLPLPLGSNDPMSQADAPAPSEASRFIIKKALEASPEDPLHLVILGSCTNVASAIVEDPTIIPNIKVHYLGFWLDPETNSYNKKEFNSGNDTIAVNVLLDTRDLDMAVMTATTSQHLVFRKEKVDEELKGKGGIADYLVKRWETYERWWTQEDPEKREWIMWDVAIIEALIHPEWSTVKAFETPPENVNRVINIHTKIDQKKMEEEFWNTMRSIME